MTIHAETAAGGVLCRAVARPHLRRHWLLTRVDCRLCLYQARRFRGLLQPGADGGWTPGELAPRGRTRVRVLPRPVQRWPRGLSGPTVEPVL